MGSDDAEMITGRSVNFFQTCKLPAPVKVTPSYLGSRICAQSSRHAFIASGKEIYQLSVRRDETEAMNGESEFSFSTCTPLNSVEARQVQAKKQNTYSGMEICSVRGIKDGESSFRMASIDMAGGICLYSFRNCGEHFAEQEDPPVDFIQGHGFCDGEGGWGGVDFSPCGSQLAAARNFQKSVCIYDLNTGKETRKINLALMPYSMTWVGNGRTDKMAGSGLLALTEFNFLSLWDPRVGGRSACVARVSPCNSLLLTTAWGEGIVGCAGMDRSVYVYDARKWNVCGRAMSVTKSDIMKLSFSSVNSKIFYAFGVDSQAKAVQEDVPVTVSTGGHKGTHVVTGGSLRKVFEFRAGGRWIAAQKLDDEDLFWGVCDQQVLYSSAKFDVASGASRKRKIEDDDKED
ncbi:hypothetical protein GUITHDRAFT_104810 [Guillardia theta CCMP2712]|uniref:DUF2415 domain-containing protein n=1 Tax=Guillardia theta (strain CCMP2712) TaxID=905079 RepID=L1JL99_GUITC|nr:hypothetical protein GUITHDRAFT_104810 [Guillardia theta CCMP2712]EKX49281.1 hypothetical protein GUITHDRAFT_104810 [Guillardia theta CCMP2712]|eukprot:XP_005836261.1 hypothetical protein GUITHDRAFT_104810 [Guillardia theta CCMP2712]